MVPEIEVIAQKIAKTKNVVLKTRLDSNTVKLHVEQLKKNFFTKLGFIKPKTKNIQLVGFEKYYEPYIIIGGKYSIDYCRKHDFKIQLAKKTPEIFIAGKKYESIISKSGTDMNYQIHLEGEEYSHYENETFFILDRLRREILPDNFPFAPYDVQLEEINFDSLNLRKINTSMAEIIELLRKRIAKRPSDLAEIIREVFDITENTIIYKPFFEFTYQNIKTSNCVTIRVDGISGESLHYKLEKRNNGLFNKNTSLNSLSRVPLNDSNPIPDAIKQTHFDKTFSDSKINSGESNKISKNLTEIENASTDDVILKFPAFVTGEVFLVGDNVTAVVGDLEIPSGTTVNETLVVKGKLKIGDNCRLSKKVKVLGDVTIGTDTVIDGNVISGGNVAVSSGSTIGGCIKATGAIKISKNVLIGQELTSNLDLPRDSFDLQTIVDLGKEETLVY